MHWQVYIFKEMGRTMLKKHLHRFISNIKKKKRGGTSKVDFEIQSTSKIKKKNTDFSKE